MASSRGGDGAEAVRLRVLLPGLYAWAACVLSVVAGRGVPLEARLAAGLAVASLVVGCLVAPSRPALGRALSLHVFVGACLGSWLALGRFLAVDRLDPLHAALGAVGWVMFALAWGASREVSSVPEDDPHALPGEPLRPRSTIPRGGALIVALAVAGALAAPLLAWRVTRPHHALLAHAAAILTAIAVVTSGAQIAVRRGRWKRLEPGTRRLGQAMLPLLALAVLVLVGLIGLLST